MANTPISGLSSGSAVSGTDLFPDVQTVGVGPVKVTASQIATYVAGNLGNASGTSLTLTGNLQFSNDAPGYTAIATTGGTTTLSSSSTFYQNFTGTLTQTIKLPDETTISVGTAYVIDNDSTSNLTVQTSAGGAVATVTPGMAGYIYSTSNATATGGWAGYAFVPGSGPTGGITWGTAGLNLGGGSLTAASLALGGATIGSNALAVTGAFLLGNASTLGTYISSDGNSINVGNSAANNHPLFSFFYGYQGINLASSTYLGFTSSSANAASSNPDTYLTRAAAATLQHGAADAAAPVAQTIGVQNVVAGTSNTNGANFTIRGSAGTGTGLGGSIIFQVAPAGTTGTAQNAFVTGLQITPNASYGGLISTLGSTNIFFYQTDNSTFAFTTAGFGYVPQTAIKSGTVQLSSIGSFSFSSSTNANGSQDTVLSRAAAATLQLGAADAAAPVAQTIGVQNVVAGTSNTNGANFTIRGSAGTGTGLGGSIIFQVAPAGTTGTAQNAFATALTIDSTKTVTFAGVSKTTPSATLPSSPAAGMIAAVNTATSPTIGLALTLGGSAYALAWYNNAQWTVIGN